MTKRHASPEGGEVFSDILAADRALDAIGRGELSAEHKDDPIVALLTDARRQAELDLPPAPNLSQLLGDEGASITNDAPQVHTALSAYPATPADNELVDEPQENRALRRSISAIAAGGASASAMLVAGGVAAALAVGGLGYAAYTTTQTKLTPEPESTAPVDGSTSPRTSGERGGRPSATDRATDTNGDESRAGKPVEAPPRESDVAPAPEGTDAADPTTSSTAVTNQDAIPAIPEDGGSVSASAAPTDAPSPDASAANDGASADGQPSQMGTAGETRRLNASESQGSQRPKPPADREGQAEANPQALLAPLTEAAEAARMRGEGIVTGR